MKQKRIVCIGGGTGTFVVLRGLKSYPYHLDAIVTMSDSGGSNKRIRDEFGLLPTSDIRQCFVALSEENGGVGLLRKLFMYRFEKGAGISGMTFGNLFMAALTDILGSQEAAIRQTGKVLRIRGTVIPVSFSNTNLIAYYEDGSIRSEEHDIDEPSHDGKIRITKIILRPKATGNPEAISAIRKADLVVIGPGDLYTSLLPNLLVGGIADALKQTRAHKSYIINLMTKYGQTYNFSAQDHVSVIEKHIGAPLDSVIMHSGVLPKKARELYAKYDEYPVTDDIPRRSHCRVIRANIASSVLYEKSSSDTLIRSLIRHDSKKLAQQLVSLLE